MKQTLEEAKREYIEKRVSHNEYASFGEAFIAGAEWHEKQSPWISVKERNPLTSKEVFIYHNGECFVGYLSWTMCTYWWNRISMLDTEAEPVDDEDYWMDKPELPE